MSLFPIDADHIMRYSSEYRISGKMNKKPPRFRQLQAVTIMEVLEMGIRRVKPVNRRWTERTAHCCKLYASYG